MAFSWGSFAGGVGEGIEQGEDIERKRREAEAQRRMEMATRSRGQYDIAQGGQGQPPPPPQGGQLQPQGSPPGQPTALPPGVPPGARPMPQAQPPTAQARPQPPQPQGQPAPQVAPQGPRPVPAPMGGPQAPRPAPPPMGQPQGGVGPQGAPGPQGAAPQPQVGSTQQGDPNDIHAQMQQIRQETQTNLKQIVQGVLAANPNLKNDPETLAMTVDGVIQQSKGLDESDKVLLTGELNISKIQGSLYNDYLNRMSRERQTDERVGATERGQDVRSATADRQMQAAMDRLHYAQTEQDKRAALGDATRVIVEKLNQQGQDDRFGTLMDFKQTLENDKVDLTNAANDLKAQGVNATLVDRVFAAEESGLQPGQPAPTAPGAPHITPRPIPRPFPGKGGGTNKSGMSEADIKASIDNARTALKKHPDQRATILKTLKDAGIPTTGL